VRDWSDPHPPRGRNLPESGDAIVLGAGWAGMYMLHSLRQLGLQAHVIEVGDGVGGTWFWNRYPGARCDVPVLNCAHSFHEDIWQKWNWSEKYCAQPELESYANYVADTLDLRPHMTFGTRVTAAHYDTERCRWRLITDRGNVGTAQYCIFAAGGYSVPLSALFAGLGDYREELYYTARSPCRPVSSTRKRIGVVGTGSSGMQTIALIGQGDEFEQLYVFLARDDTQYLGANVPGKARAYLAYVGGFERYARICDQVARDGYAGFVRHSRGSPVPAGPAWRGPVLPRSNDNTIVWLG
jgi:cyclohexanone monooxygenase